MIGIAISISGQRGFGAPAPPSSFASTQWQLITFGFWNNITDTWT